MAIDECGAEDWPRRLTRTIGLAVRRYRVGRGWQVGDLAERTEHLGYHVTEQRIYNLETGRRGAAVADLVVIAAALDVPLTLLLAPLDPPTAAVTDRALADYPTVVEALPGRTVPAHVAIAEWTGTALPDTADTDERAEAWSAAVEPLNLYRLADDLVFDLIAADNGVDGAELGANERAGTLRQLAETLTRLDERGLTRPDIPAEYAAELAAPRPRRRARTAGRRAVRGLTTTTEETE